MLRDRIEPLEIFGGRSAPEDFVADLNNFHTLNKDLQRQVITKTLAWYARPDVEKEWESWIESAGKENEEEIKKAVRVIMFMATKGLQRRLSEEQFEDELAKIGLDSDLSRHFLTELSANREQLARKLEKSGADIVPRLSDIYWRVDIKKSSALPRGADEVLTIIKLELSGGEESDITFELSRHEVSSLINTLTMIQREMDMCTKEIPN